LKKPRTIQGNIKTFLFVILFANLPFLVMAQHHHERDLIGLSGVVLTADSLRPVADAKVFSRESFRGTFTDDKGRFTLAVVLGDTLLFSSLGYADTEVAVNDSLLSLRAPVRFFMRADTVQINEVVIHAFLNYRMFKQQIINMKPQTQPLNLFHGMYDHPRLHIKPYDVGVHLSSPIQTLYNLYNSKAILQRHLLRNRRRYNRNMLKQGLTHDTVHPVPDYMWKKQR
jgi:hypothetical protein